MRPTRIILHHSATKDSGTVSWSAIRRYHIDTQKWADVGYHFGIEMVGAEAEVFAGRPLDTPGAHTVGQNAASLGICCVGDYDTDELPEAIYRRLVPLLKGLMVTFGIPSSQIFRHADFAPKTCPGTRFPMTRLVAELKSLGL